MLKDLMDKIKSFIVNEEGSETIEWTVVVAILAALIVTSFNGTLKSTLLGSFAKIMAAINSI